MKNRYYRSTLIAVIGGLALVIILVFGTIWVGNTARRDTETAVRSVSLLYLGELAGRREQVVAENMQEKINVIGTALGLMTEEDLRTMESLQAYQAKMKQLFVLEKFAFVDTDGLIYTYLGTQTDIDQYQFDHRTISGPEISIKNLQSEDKKVIIAVPVNMSFQDKELVVCFMEIDMKEMLSGVSMDAQEDGATFCNMYTSEGIALSDTVLGGLAVEDNLLEALEHAVYEPGYSYEAVVRDFSEGNQGVVSFTYNGIRETLTYVPVSGTNWLLTYLIRESVISESISSVSSGIIRRSMIQTALTVLVLLGMFALMFRQARRNARLTIEKETADARNRVKQEEMERQLALQNELLAQKQQQEEQNRMIAALASDYWSVYYLDLDTDDGVCYQAHEDVENGFKAGDRFKYLAAVTAYAKENIKEEYLEEFLRFVQPEM